MLEKTRVCKNISEFQEARVVTFLNPYSFLKLSESNIDLGRFDKICIDGVALKIFLDLAYGDTNIERISFDFTSIANMVFENANSGTERGFVLGSDQNSNRLFLSKIRSMYPGIKVGGRSGFFDSDKERDALLGKLTQSEYDYIIIGMGAVMQERVAVALMDHGFKGRIYTCGGFIHQTAMGGEKYYPSWVNKYNLRFAYRMFKEPSTIGRYLIDYPKAFFLLTRNIRAFKY